MNAMFRVLIFLFSLTIGISATPSVFDAAWRGFDTGVFGEGFAPSSFVIGDVDSDGYTDLLVGDSYYGYPGVTLLKNNGDKTFAPPIYFALPQGQNVGEVALTDVDLDGDLDALATIRGSFDEMTVLKVWRNNGNGVFQSPPASFTAGQAPAGLIVGDFTSDGRQDIVTANYGGRSVSLLRHNGSQGFLSPVTFTTGLANDKIAVADVNGDSKLDIAAGGYDAGTLGKIAVLIGNGAGDSASPVIYDAAPDSRVGSSAVALKDLDNDGDVDLIGGGLYSAGSVDAGAVTVRRNNGTGVFGNAEVLPYFENYTSHPREITTADLNNDGFADILATVPSGRAVEGFETILSNGIGGFYPPIYSEASQQTFDVLALDIDADSDLDVLTLANSSAAVTVHENPGNGAFHSTMRYEVASLSDAVESADIDNDGDLDVVVNGEVDIASNDAIVKILKNNGNGTFAEAISYSPARNFADIKLRDINGDGFVDLIFAPDGNYPSFHIGTALNNGDGTFATTVVKQLFACGEGTIDAVDLDGDGDREIVFTDEQGCSGGVPPRIFILRNDGNQNFTQMQDINTPGIPHGLTLADVNQDGEVDIVTALPGGMAVYAGNGDLTFGGPFISSTQPYKFKLADFNNDAKLDVGMILEQDSFGTDNIATALGNGDGTFQAIRTQSGSSVLENLRISDDIEIGDFNEDGTPDVVVINYASNDISYFAVNADGSLRRHERYGIGNTPHFATAGDFTGDGKPDIVAAVGLPPSGLHNAVVLLRKMGVASAGGRAPFDFDGDGKTDMSVFRPWDGTWWWHRSGDGQIRAAQFGSSGDTVVAGDYTGDGKTDLAFWRPLTGQWFIVRSEDGSFFAFPFGTSEDIPMPADYDGDGKTDAAVFRPSSATWFISRSSDSHTSIVVFGTAGDRPVAADYDGDGKADIAIYRPSGTTGGSEWWIVRSGGSGIMALQFGSSSDKAVVGDYTGDDKDDIAVWRPTNGNWYVIRSEDLSYFSFQFGVSGDAPVPGDYDGDGKSDASIFRPSQATWFVQRTTAGQMIAGFGLPGDKPVPNTFVR